MRLEQFMERIDRRPWPAPRPAVLRWSRALARRVWTLADAVLSLLDVMLSMPAYLADQTLDHVCPGAPAAFAADGSSPDNATCHLEAELHRLTGGTRWMNSSSSAGRLSLFYGAPGTLSYPLHADVADGDVFFRVFRGAKRFALFVPAAAPSLGQLAFLPCPVR